MPVRDENSRSRDKDGGHSIESAIVENPIVDANTAMLHAIEPELLTIEVLNAFNIWVPLNNTLVWGHPRECRHLL